MSQGTWKYELGRFESADSFLSSLGSDAVARLLTASADLVLVLDAQGHIKDMALNSEELVNLGCREWLGRPWSSTVTVESRSKLDALVKEALASTRPGARQVNHPLPTGTDLPVSYRVVPVRPPGAAPLLVAFGRDLRPEMAMQQRLVSAQVSMERDYWRLRHVETRYRLLFQQAAEPVLILDASSEKLEEANPAAQALFGDPLRKAGWTLTDSLDAASGLVLRDVLARVRASGRTDPVSVRLVRGDECALTVSLFRQENSSHLLVRLAPARQAGAAAREELPVGRLLQDAPDALVATDLEGRVLRVNRAFLTLTQVATDEAARGESLDRWLGRSGVDLNVLVSNLRQHGTVRLFATQLRGGACRG